MADYSGEPGFWAMSKDSEPGKIADEDKKIRLATEAVDEVLEKSDQKWVTKDSGARAQFESGMQRDTEEGKARFDLLVPLGVPYEEQILTRFANLLARGAEKYTERNWEKANSKAELNRYKSSAYRHFMQWITGETDEDHAAAVMFNLMCYETTKWKMENDL